jgi:GrpB-like predicted nucleotidyltransferase (UPF0157 family)
MPFSDEPTDATIVSYRPEWAAEFESLRARLAEVLGSLAVAIDHVGSTAVPGLAAKDCIDVQVGVRSPDAANEIKLILEHLGFRLRPEHWNQSEVVNGRIYRKLVFAPPPGARLCNVHVRQDGEATARRNLLFRDYLASNPNVRDAWGEFKLRLSGLAPDLATYGHVKAPAWETLMAGAEWWEQERELRGGVGGRTPGSA